MASQLFCLALLVASAFGAYDLSYRQQYLPLRNYGIYNQQGGSSRQGQIPYSNYLLQNMRYSPAFVQQQGVEGQVYNPLTQLWQQFFGNTEGLFNSYPEIMNICQRINMPVQGHFQQTIGVNELREINQRLNFLGNTEGLFYSYPEIVEFCQQVNSQVQGLGYPTTGVTVPFAQTNTEGSLRYNNVLAPRYQSLYQYQPVSQAYPAQQNIFSLWGLRPSQQFREQYLQQQLPSYQSPYQYQPVSQFYPSRQNIFSLFGLRPTQQFSEQYMQQQLPSYFANNDYIQRNNFNVENNLVY